jgi:polysaccharide deacetylase 2 family uncharacterized protein YibQ
MNKVEELHLESSSINIVADHPTTADLIEQYLNELKAAGIELEPYDPEKDAEERLWL